MEWELKAYIKHMKEEEKSLAALSQYERDMRGFMGLTGKRTLSK